MYYVIGSGPAGVACAHALLEAGKIVTMLDAGLRLEPERKNVVDEMARNSPDRWRPDWHAFIREGMAATKEGVPFKRLFGSDFPYRETDRHLPADGENIGLRPSLAQGGLSNVWGAAMLPYSERDLRGWPLRAADLEAHYAAVVRLTGLAGQHDDLAAFAPLYTDTPSSLRLSRQAERLMAHLQRHRSSLARDGWHFGHSRLAVAGTNNTSNFGCVYCGTCMYGCPYGYIYNSAATLARLRMDPNFSYQPDVIVETVAETGGEVLIRGFDRVSGAPRQWHAERVFSAGGPIPTTRLLLWSQQAFGRRVQLRDSQYFLFPFLLPSGDSNPEQERLHTLSQIFVELMDDLTDQHTVHAQLYTYNDLWAGAVESAFPFHNAISRAFARMTARRLGIVQSYLHSDHSSRIGVELTAPVSGQPPRLRLKAEINPEARRRARQIAWKFTREARRFGALAVPPLLQITPVGRGHHTGGSFPMRLQPVEFETDLLGRPAGWQRVHAVDATVFPNIPATTITLSVMANAHRIGTAAAQL